MDSFVDMKIIVSIKNVWGNELIYPICPKAKLLAELTGKVTLTPFAITKIKALGYEVEVERPTL